ncbi:putative ribonuclease H-like domain-containing protein [Tanacetum coccineum]
MALTKFQSCKEFHRMTDAKEMWDAIKSRFSGNDESKKMQKYILKQQFEGFYVSNLEGLHKAMTGWEKIGNQEGKLQKPLVTIDGEGVDWTSHSKEEEDYALMAYNSSGLDTEMSANDKFGLSTETPELVSKPVVNETNVACQPKVWSDAPIIEEYESDSEDEYVSIPTKEQETPSFANQQVKTLRETVKNHFAHSKNPKVDKKELRYGFTTRACFVCGSLNHLIRDCDFHEKRMAKQAELNNRLNRNSSQREIRPIWNNVQRVNNQNQFVPTAVLTRTGKIPVNTTRVSGTKRVSTARHSFNRQAVLTSAAMKVNNVKPIVNRVRPTTVWFINHSPNFPRPFNKKQQQLRTNFSKQKVNTAKVLFTDSECLVLSPEFKLPDANQVLLRIPRQNNMYSFNLENIVPLGGTENRVNKHAGPPEANQNAGTEDIIDAWDSEKEDESAQDYFILPISSSYSSTIKRSRVEDAGVAPHKHPDLKTNEKPVDKEDQVFLDELERLKRQEKDANDAVEALRKEFAQETENLLIQAIAFAKASSTNIVNIVSTPVSTAMADFTNLESVVNVSPIPTSRIHSIHPSTLILGDPKSAVQTRSKVTKSSGAHAFHGYRRELMTSLFSDLKDNHDIILVQVYVDDIIFSSTKKTWCDEFEALMKGRFQMSSTGELTFFLRLQVKQKADGIFISQDKYVAEILKKFDFVNVKTASTPIETQKPLVKDEEASDVDVHLYRSMIGSLMYLKGKPKLGLWYPRVSLFDIEVYSDSDYAGANIDRKSTTGGCQFLGRKLISWKCKTQTIVATSTTEAEYVAAANCCGQVLWIQNQIPKIKHIAIRRHFIRDAYEKKLIQVLKIHTDDNVADLLTKAFDVSSSLGFRESLGRALDGTEALTLISFSPTITHSNIMAVLESCPKHNMVAYLEKTKGNAEFHEIIDFLTRSSIHHALTGKSHLYLLLCWYNQLEDEGALSERPSEAQSTPSPPHPSEATVDPQSDPSLVPSPSSPRFLIYSREDQVGIMEVSDQAKEIQHLKAQIKKLKKQAKPVITHHRAWMKSVSLKQRLAGKRSLKKNWMQKEYLGRTRDVVDKEKENAEYVLSTEDVLSTAQQKVSIDREKVSTDKLIVSTDGSKVSTDKEKDSTDRTDEEFTLLNISQAKEVSRENEKAVEFKDIEGTERPRPTSTRSLLTLKPLPKIDPKDKGTKKIKEEDESKSESDGIPEAEKKFKQLASDEEMARKVQEEWEGKEERKRLAEEEATNDALIRNYDDIKARIEGDRLLAERLQEQEREQFTVEERAKYLHDTIAAQRKFLGQQRSEATWNKPPIKNQLRYKMITYLKHVGNY